MSRESATGTRRARQRTVVVRVVRFAILPCVVLVVGLGYSSWVRDENFARGERVQEELTRMLQASWQGEVEVVSAFPSSHPIILRELEQRLDALATSTSEPPRVAVVAADDGPGSDGSATHTARLVVSDRCVLGLRMRVETDGGAIALVGVFAGDP